MTRSLPSRRGSTLVVAIVVMTLILGGTGILLRMIVLRQQQLTRRLWQHQAECLALSALDRAEQRLLRTPAYPGEDWTVALTDSQLQSGRVSIVVNAGSDPLERQIVVQAVVPDHHQHRVQVTLSRGVQQPDPRFNLPPEPAQ